MAAAVGFFVGRRRFAFSGPLLLHMRTIAAKRKALRAFEQRKHQDDVFLLNYRAPPSHTFAEALSALRAYAITNIDQTVELHIKINMGDKKTKINPFHGLMLLPKQYGKEREVLVFAKDEAAEIAKNAGANIVGGEELIKKVADGELTDFHQVLCTLEFLSKMRPLQRILREKMPTTRRGTASDDIATAIRTYKQGHPYRCDRLGYVNIGVGKLSFTDADVRSNTLAVISTVLSHRISTKGKFFEKMWLSSSNGPGFRLLMDELVS
ncbi:unnamed protein product [Porites lobata]|uniref:Ribosomal protein L1 n=1 Tax=Porites lobata TaxID=104759 RepID=A0ABN8PUX0_9CNID|nr:unnamed protein product [Porites lobata]